MKLARRLAVAGLAVAACGGGASAATPGWPQWGGPALGNQRDATRETVLTTGNVGQLQVQWRFVAKGNIAASPSVQGNALYVTDDGGGVYRLDATTGKPVWSHMVSDYTALSYSESRSTPAVAGSLIIIADRQSGNVIGVDKATGSLAWITSIESNPYVRLTGSPTVYNGVVYIGTSSNEEYEASVNSNYVPSFRGSVVALNAASGQMLWKTPLAPTGYTGAAVWGSGFPILPSRGLLFAATGNNYTVPAQVQACVQKASDSRAQLRCLGPDDDVDSVVALDISSGQIQWAHRLQGADTYTLNCTSPNPAQPCPQPAGPDYDFGSGPSLLPGARGTLVGAGQKSGAFWTLDAQAGVLSWATQAGPGGRRGGIMWGSAVGPQDVFVAENDYGHISYGLGPGGTARTTGGSWAALNTATGRIDWQVAVGGSAPDGSGNPAGTESAMTVADGIVFGGTTAGRMVALDASSGKRLWSFDAGAGITSGAVVVNGHVYWGSGDPYGRSGNTLFAFSLP